MIHMRIVAPHKTAQSVIDMFCQHESVTNVVHLEGAAQRPAGDLILADVAREDASVILSDLRELEIPEHGSIAMEEIDIEISEAAKRAEKAAVGAVSDAVVWEEIEARTSETTELSWSFITFMVLSMLIASVGIYLDTPILIIGAMVVGPEFGPIAGFCVAVVQRRPALAGRSFLALAVGFPIGITAVWLASLAFKATGVTPETFTEANHTLSNVIASPDFFTFFVAFCAGAAGVLSLTTAKSGALIGVLISVTTIPAAANIGVAFAYQDWHAWRGSQLQLLINLASVLGAGVFVLGVQRYLFRRRRLKHLGDPIRTLAGLPVGRSRRGTHVLEGDALRRAHEAADRAAAERTSEKAHERAESASS
jgi:uncharacterized hydrophobic protein (TIGR00271 family)